MKYLKELVLACLIVVGLASAVTFAALPADVDTAITAAQTDLLAMIGKGFAYVGAVVGLWVVLGMFSKILKKK